MLTPYGPPEYGERSPGFLPPVWSDFWSKYFLLENQMFAVFLGVIREIIAPFLIPCILQQSIEWSNVISDFVLWHGEDSKLPVNGLECPSPRSCNFGGKARSTRPTYQALPGWDKPQLR